MTKAGHSPQRHRRRVDVFANATVSQFASCVYVRMLRSTQDRHRGCSTFEAKFTQAQLQVKDEGQSIGLMGEVANEQCAENVRCSL